MGLYTSFFGIDIGKSEFVSFLNSDDTTKSYKNSLKGFKSFLSDHKEYISSSLVILEACRDNKIG